MSKIALKINDREIEVRELREEWESIKNHIDRNPSSPHLSDALTFRYAKENIINRVLLEEEAELRIEEIDFKIIQEEYEKLVSHYGGLETMKNRLGDLPKKGRITPHHIKSQIEKSLKVNKLLDMWSENVSTPNEGEMMSFYEHNRDQFMSPQQILFSKFFLPNKPDPQNKILMEGLADYREQHRDYQDFLSKAQKIPNLDYQEKFYLIPGKIQPKVESVLLELADAEISGIIQTEEGYFIFKRWSTIPPKKLEYDEVRQGIEKILFEEKKQKRIREHLAQLRHTSEIEDLLIDPQEIEDQQSGK